MPVALSSVRQAMRTSALCSLAFLLVSPLAAGAFNPNEGATPEPTTKNRPVRAKLPSTAPLVAPMPRLIFSDMAPAAPAEPVPLPAATIPPVADAATPMVEVPPSAVEQAQPPVYPPVDPAVAARAAQEMQASAPPAPTLPPPPAPETPLAQSFAAPAPLMAVAPVTAPLIAPAPQPAVPSVSVPEPTPSISPPVVAPQPAAPEPLATLPAPPADAPPAVPVVVAVPTVEPTPAAPPPGTEGLSDRTKDIVSHIPSKLDTNKTKSGKLAVKRMTPELQDLGKTAGKVESYDATGLSIKVRRPGLDTNYELNRAYSALMGGDTTQAIETYKNILSADPSNEDALFGLASTYHRAGDLERARPYYGQLLKVNPNHREGLNNFLVLMSDESPQEALAELDRLEQRNPDFSPIPAQQGIILGKLGYMDQAREKMLRAIELAPENMTYKYNLAIMLDKHGEYADAAALYRLLIDTSLKGAQIPAPLATLQKRLNFIAAAPAPTAIPASGN